jgi:hypothetical protein
MMAGALADLRRDRGAEGGAEGGTGSVSSIFGFFARLDGGTLDDSAGVPGLGSGIEALRFRDFEVTGVGLVGSVEAAGVVAGAVDVSAASLAAERVTLKDIRTSSILSCRHRPSVEKWLTRMAEVG